MNKHRTHLPKWIALPEDSRKTIFETISEESGLSPEVVEKDWWLTLTLDLVFSLSCAKALVFKGGTSLSKGWGLIERFSEDIDLALDREFLGFTGELGKNQRDRLRKASVRYAIEDFMPELQDAFKQAGFSEVKLVALEPQSSDDDPVKIDIYFPKLTVADGYLKPGLQIELGARSLREPFSPVYIKSLVAFGKYFQDRDFIDSPIQIPIVNPERTYLEKIFLLHEEHQRPEVKRRVDRLSRHLYDIYQISKTEFAEKALADPVLFQEIVSHRQRYSKVAGIDYSLHQTGTLSFIPPDEVLPDWEKDYKQMQESMIYGENLPFAELMAALTQLQTQLNQHTWTH